MTPARRLHLPGDQTELTHTQSYDRRRQRCSLAPQRASPVLLLDAVCTRDA